MSKKLMLHSFPDNQRFSPFLDILAVPFFPNIWIKSTKSEGFDEFNFFHNIGGAHIAYVLISMFDISRDIFPEI